MRHIDMQTWPRRDLFSTFSTFDHPHCGMCADIDLASESAAGATVTRRVFKICSRIPIFWLVALAG